MFLETARIDRLDTPIDTIDGDLRRTQSHDRTQLLMRRLDGPIISHSKAPPQHPNR